MSLSGALDEQRVADAWKAAMADVLKFKDQKQIPEMNEEQCDTHQMHLLTEAQDILDNAIRVNQKDELALPKEKLAELHI